MTIVKGDPAKGGEQLTFKGLELASVVREIEAVEFQRKETNDDFKDRLKALKKRMVALANEIKEEEAAR